MYYLIPYIKSSCYGLQSSIKTGLTSSLSRLLSWTHSPLLIYISPHSIIILYRSSIYFLHSIYFIFCSSPPSLHPAHPNCIFLHIRDFVSIEFLAHNMYTGIFAEWLNDTPGSIIIQLQILYKSFGDIKEEIRTVKHPLHVRKNIRHCPYTILFNFILTPIFWVTDYYPIFRWNQGSDESVFLFNII